MNYARIFQHVRGFLPREFGIIFGVGVLAICLLAFAFIVDDVFEDGRYAFDEAVLKFFRTPADLARPVGPEWLEYVMRDITSLGGTTVLVLIVAACAGYLLMKSKHWATVFLLVSVGGGVLLSNILKLLFQRPRPDLVPHLTHFSNYSFPSGHSLMSATVYLTLGAILCRTIPDRYIRIYVLCLAVAVTFLVGLSRVYLGVHWPTDVLAGWCVGAGWAIICWLAAVWLQRKHAI